MNAGLIIKLLRTAEGLSQEDLADRLGVTRPYLSQVENGRREPGLTFLRSVTRELDVPLPLLVMGDDSSESTVLNELRGLLAKLLEARVTLWTQQ